jgi:hypothetical protein
MIITNELSKITERVRGSTHNLFGKIDDAWNSITVGTSGKEMNRFLRLKLWIILSVYSSVCNGTTPILAKYPRSVKINTLVDISAYGRSISISALMSATTSARIVYKIEPRIAKVAPFCLKHILELRPDSLPN